MSFSWIAAPLPLADLDIPSRRLVTALRRWAIAGRMGRWPVGALQAELGCQRAAAHVQLVVEEIGVAWPDPFCVAPPCCRATSHDEALLAVMASTAATCDRPAFDRACCDLLGGDARDRLFLSLRLAVRAIAVA